MPMSHSMTGFGSAAKRFGGYIMQFEIKSVNHRYSEVVIRMPREWTRYEDGLRRIVQRHIKRGRIDVYISKERDDESIRPFVLNSSVIDAYMNVAEELRLQYNLDTSLSVKDILSLPDALISPDPISDGSAAP